MPLTHRWLTRHPHFHIHFTATGSSWINLVERWFAALTDKQLRRGVHRNTRELAAAIRHSNTFGPPDHGCGIRGAQRPSVVGEWGGGP